MRLRRGSACAPLLFHPPISGFMATFVHHNTLADVSAADLADHRLKFVRFSNDTIMDTSAR